MPGDLESTALNFEDPDPCDCGCSEFIPVIDRNDHFAFECRECGELTYTAHIEGRTDV